MAGRHPITRPVDPTPHGAQVSSKLLWFGLLGSPIAWSLFTTLNYGVASHACFPGRTPRETALPGWEAWLEPTLIAVGIAAAAVAVASAVVSLRIWRRTQGEAARAGIDGLLEVGEGRTRFFAAWGVLTSALFLCVIVFGFVGMLWLPPCSGLF